MRASIQFMKEHFSGNLCGAEVGVEEGVHSEQILSILPVTQYYAIDPWVPFCQQGKGVWSANICDEKLQRARSRLERFDFVTIMQMSSAEGSTQIEDGTLDFVYIDANHQYSSVLEDILLWYPKVRKGGVLAGHDYCTVWRGVMGAVQYASELLGISFQNGHTAEEGWDDWWLIV